MTDSSWSAIKSEYPIGRKVEGIIKRVWQFGVRIELAPGVTGLIRNKELSWDQLVGDATTFEHQGKALAEGRKVRVSILRHDPRERELLLSLRRAVYDPWDHLGDRFQEGECVRGSVALIAKNYAIVELADCQRNACITARLPKEEIVPWQIASIEEVLERKDTVEAIVQRRDMAAREIVVSMRARFEQIGRELAGVDEPVWLPPVGADATLNGGVAGEIREAPRRKIERVLLIDDEEDQRLNVEGHLEELGIDHLEFYEDFDVGAQHAIQELFDLILMDVKGISNPTAGLEAAESILRARPDACIVLVTGDIEVMRDERANRILLDTAGSLLKPIIFANLAEAISRLERIGHAGWPGLLDGEKRPMPGFGQGISQTSSRRRPLKEVLQEILQEVAHEIGADRAAVFSMDMQTSRVELEAGMKIPLSDLRYWKEKLPKSPINDVIYEGEEIFENDVTRKEGKFRNLRRLFPFTACIGLPVRRTAGDLGYGLFLFRSDQQHFIDADLKLGQAAADVIGLAIREQWLIHQVAADQRLTMLGSAMSSVGHELRNRLGDVEAVVPLDRSWQEVRRNPAKLQDVEFISRFERNLERLKTARQGMSGLADLLLGAGPERPEQIVNVNNCVQAALRLVALEAKDRQITLVSDLSAGMLLTKGNALELQHIFLNIFLNAIQQIPRARRGRGRVTVKTGLDRNDPKRSIWVRITDSGPGIHAKNIDKVFEPMFTTKPQGTGLGLYICRDLLSTMDGTIEVGETAILVGTTFEVRLSSGRQE